MHKTKNRWKWEKFSEQAILDSKHKRFLMKDSDDRIFNVLKKDNKFFEHYMQEYISLEDMKFFKVI